MRALKTLLIILLSLLALLVVLGLMGPSTYRVERSAVVAAPPEVVYGYVSRLESMKQWGPWQEMDKDQVQSLEGADGTVGAVWKWEGDTVGKGSQTIMSLEPNRSVRCKLHFVEPFESISTATYDLQAVGDSTMVTWGMEGENGFMGKVMGVFMDMDKMIGPDFEKGLANLKGLAEKEQADKAAAVAGKTFGGYVIETIERPEMVYVGKRSKVKFSELEKFYGSSFGAAGAAIGTAGLNMAGAPSGVYFQWDEKAQVADLFAGMPVVAPADVKLPGMEVYTVPASKMLHIAYYGSYDGSMRAHMAMDEMIQAKGFTHYGNVIEEFITDPMAEPDTTKWLTNIYYMIK
jgi:effector-binding domain-containing protein